MFIESGSGVIQLKSYFDYIISKKFIQQKDGNILKMFHC